MLQVEREVGAVQAVLIIAERCIQWLAQIATDNVFVAKLTAKGCAACCPVEVAVEVDAESIGAVMVERNQVFRSANQFEAVVAAIPVDGRFQVQTARCLALNGCEELQRPLCN